MTSRTRTLLRVFVTAVLAVVVVWIVYIGLEGLRPKLYLVLDCDTQTKSVVFDGETIRLPAVFLVDGSMKDIEQLEGNIPDVVQSANQGWEFGNSRIRLKDTDGHDLTYKQMLRQILYYKNYKVVYIVLSENSAYISSGSNFARSTVDTAIDNAYRAKAIIKVKNGS